MPYLYGETEMYYDVADVLEDIDVDDLIAELEKRGTSLYGSSGNSTMSLYEAYVYGTPESFHDALKNYFWFKCGRLI